jgi:hypothetical protein
MNRGRWKLWVAGIALAQLLVLGAAVALVWPSEAEWVAAKIEVGMRRDQVWEVVNPSPSAWQPPSTFFDESPWVLNYADGSILSVEFTQPVEGRPERVALVRTTPPPPVHPLTRLRRTLARIIPALKE